LRTVAEPEERWNADLTLRLIERLITDAGSSCTRSHSREKGLFRRPHGPFGFPFTVTDPRRRALPGDPLHRKGTIAGDHMSAENTNFAILVELRSILDKGWAAAVDNDTLIVSGPDTSDFVSEVCR